MYHIAVSATAGPVMEAALQALVAVRRDLAPRLDHLRRRAEEDRGRGLGPLRY